MKSSERQRLIKDKAIPIFIGLKVAEISAAIASTVGVYYYGVLAYVYGKPALKELKKIRIYLKGPGEDKFDLYREINNVKQFETSLVPQFIKRALPDAR